VVGYAGGRRVKAALGLTLLLLAPIVLVLAPLGGHVEQACMPSTAAAIPVGREHAEALDPVQLNNAAVIVDSALSRALGRRGALIGVMTALTESSLRVLGHGDLAGPDSRGLFQQRTAWGPLGVRMNPTGSARLFFDALETLPGWHLMPAWAAAQAVQRSAFADGSNYRRNYAQAATVVDRMLRAPAGARTPDEQAVTTRTVSMSAPACASSGVTTASRVHIPSAPRPYRGGATGCALPDPTGTGGCVTGATAHALAETNAAFSGGWPWGVSCWDEHAWNPTSDHPLGRACDFTVGRLGSLPSEEQMRLGWSLAEWLRAYADRLHVDYIIWDGRIWSTDRASEGWRPYDGGGVYDVSSPTGAHRDHLPLSTEM
jgi:hypothetical protein